MLGTAERNGEPSEKGETEKRGRVRCRTSSHRSSPWNRNGSSLVDSARRRASPFLLSPKVGLSVALRRGRRRRFPLTRRRRGRSPAAMSDYTASTYGDRAAARYD